MMSCFVVYEIVIFTCDGIASLSLPVDCAAARLPTVAAYACNTSVRETEPITSCLLMLFNASSRSCSAMAAWFSLMQCADSGTQYASIAAIISRAYASLIFLKLTKQIKFQIETQAKLKYITNRFFSQSSINLRRCAAGCEPHCSSSSAACRRANASSASK